MNSTKSSAAQFRETLESEAATYRIVFTPRELDRLSKYYELLNAWNPRLHLVAPTSPKVFATRHVLESLLLLEHLPEGAGVVDVGSGAGLPIIPCLIARPDIHALLIEASGKKAIFLREALNETATAKRATVKAERFERIDPPEVGIVTCRALEHFAEMLAQLVSWAPAPGKLLLFGGEDLGRSIDESGFASAKILIPKSQKRFLYVVTK